MYVFRNRTAELCSNGEAAEGASLQRQELKTGRPASQCLFINGAPPVYWVSFWLSNSQKLSHKAGRGAEEGNLNDQGVGAAFLWGNNNSVEFFSLVLGAGTLKAVFYRTKQETSSGVWCHRY